MIIRKILFIGAILVHFCSCNDNPNYNSKKPEVQAQKFKKDIPINKDGKYVYSYSFTKKYIQKAGLKIIENGFDSMCIRLWYIYAYGPAWQVVEITKNQKEWQCEFILLTEVINNNDSSRYIQKTSVLKMPKSGWDVFLKELFSKNITTLPTGSIIPGYELNTDVDLIVVEIATKEYYRIFDYGSLKFNLGIREARVMADIMILIEKEFDVERLNKEF